MLCLEKGSAIALRFCFSPSACQCLLALLPLFEPPSPWPPKPPISTLPPGLQLPGRSPPPCLPAWLKAPRINCYYFNSSAQVIRKNLGSGKGRDHTPPLELSVTSSEGNRNPTLPRPPSQTALPPHLTSRFLHASLSCHCSVKLPQRSQGTSVSGPQSISSSSFCASF